MRETFKDLREDLQDANLEGKRLLLLIEQRGCVYCRKMHEEVFADPEVKALLEDKYFVVQLNMFGDVEVTDFDGTALPEKEMAKRWRLLFTPTLLFFPESVPETRSAPQAAVVAMPGAFSKFTTLDLLTWVFEKGYEGDENFQKYHARRFEK
jgi:thioredoxin-related protein